MAITVDYSTVSPWLITIPKADLTLESGTKYTLTVDEFWYLLRDFTDNQNTMVKPVLYSRIPATASTPSITEIDLDYYEVEFEDGAYSVNIINGNTNIREAEVKNSVSVNTNNTTGFIDPKFLQASLFAGEVSIDVVNGVAGTGTNSEGAVIGTHQLPSNNMTDALTIAQERGIETFVVHGSLTLTTGDEVAGYIFKGENAINTYLTVETGADVSNCQFNDMIITNSVLDGMAYMNHCSVANVTGIEGYMENCILSYNIKLTGTENTFIVDCKSGCVGLGAEVPVIDFNNELHNIAVRNWSGPIKVTNSNNAGTTACVDVGSGATVIVDSTVTEGEFIIRGSAKISHTQTLNEIVAAETTQETTWEVDSRDTLYLERSVWIDTGSLSVGDGSQGSPFNDLTTAIDFAEAEGINTLFVYDDIVLDRQLKNFTIIGVGTPTVDCNGQDLTRSEFKHVRLEGTYIGAIIAQECFLLNNFWLNGQFETCGLGGDLFCIDGANVLMTQCVSAIPGLNRPTISMNGAGTVQLSLRKYGGGMTIKDCNTVGDTITAEVSEGSLTFDSSCTDGNMVARGMCKFVDDSNGATVTDETGNPANVNISNKLLKNRTETNPATGIMTVYDDDGITVLFTANIWENVTATDPYIGNAVNRRETFA